MSISRRSPSVASSVDIQSDVSAIHLCFVKASVSKNFANFTGKHLGRSLFFNKVAGLKACNFMKKRLQHRCFPVKFAKFLRTHILSNINERLLVCIDEQRARKCKYQIIFKQKHLFNCHQR